MKGFVIFILTCFIGSGALLGATNMSNPWPAFVVGFGAWILFIAWLTRRGKGS